METLITILVSVGITLLTAFLPLWIHTREQISTLVARIDYLEKDITDFSKIEAKIDRLTTLIHELDIKILTKK